MSNVITLPATLFREIKKENLHEPCPVVGILRARVLLVNERARQGTISVRNIWDMMRWQECAIGGYKTSWSLLAPQRIYVQERLERLLMYHGFRYESRDVRLRMTTLSCNPQYATAEEMFTKIFGSGIRFIVV